jgi:hypothetical protein
MVAAMSRNGIYDKVASRKAWVAFGLLPSEARRHSLVSSTKYGVSYSVLRAERSCLHTSVRVYSLITYLYVIIMSQVTNPELNKANERGSRETEGKRFDHKNRLRKSLGGL